MYKLLPLLLFLRLFETNHNIKQLISQTHNSHSEVDNHCLSHNFRGVFWIGQFCCKIKFETLIIVDKIVSKFDVLLPCAIDNIFLKERIDSRIELLVNIFEETTASSSDCIL